MAQFKRFGTTATTTGETVYQTPEGKTGLAIGLILANKSSQVQYASVDINSTFIVKDAPIPVGSTLSILDGKLAIQATETLTATASVDSAIDVTLTVLEL